MSQSGMSGSQIKKKVDVIGDSIKKAFMDASLWGNENLSGAVGPDTLMGAIHQYRMWEAAFNATYQLFKTASDENINPDEMTPIGEYPAMVAPPDLLPLIEKNFTTDVGTTIENELDMGYWAAMADLTIASILPSEIGEGSIQGYATAHAAIVSGVEQCKVAIDGMDRENLNYGNAGLIVGIGLLLLQTPRALNKDDLTEVINDIDKKISATFMLSVELGKVPMYRDTEIGATIEQLLGMKLNDYVDNILTGRIFSLGDATSHAAALVNMAVMAEGVLAPCINKLNSAKRNMSAMVGSLSAGLAEMGKIITALSTAMASMTRNVSRIALDQALALIGSSSAVIDMMMGVKMQIQALRRDAEKAIRGINAVSVIAPPSTEVCPISILLNAHTVKAMAEAGVKNALMLPIIGLVDGLLKPILEEMADITSEIRSYQDMLGESLASGYKMISVQRWVDYALNYQIQQMRGALSMQIRHYQQMKNIFMSLRNRIKDPDKRYKIIERAFRSYVRSISSVAEEHDQQVALHGRAYERMSECIQLLEAVSSLLTKRSPDSKDKEAIFTSMEKYGNLLQEGEEASRAIRESSNNIMGMWKEITQMRAEDFVGLSVTNMLDTFKEYSKLVKIVFGLDLSDGIEELKGLFEEKMGTLPAAEMQKPQTTNNMER